MKVKYLKRLLAILFIVIFFLTGFAPVRQAVSVFGTPKSDASAKPIFSSSFIQYWYCEDFDQARWNRELTMLQRLGVNEIILQAISFSDIKYATYPTQLEGYTRNDVDMVENVLTAADSLSMNVRIGLGFNADWWNKRASDLEWLNKEAETNKSIIDEVVAMYGKHPSLTGWYIPYEFSQATAPTIIQQSYLNSFYGQIASEIKRKSPRQDIMVSPFYIGKYSWIAPLALWSSMTENILRGTGVDILALQDAVGANYSSPSELVDIFASTKKATDSIGIKLYSVTETFSSSFSGNTPASQNAISTQISLVRSYVQGFAAFSLSHYQNLYQSNQVHNFNEYYDYYIANR